MEALAGMLGTGIGSGAGAAGSAIGSAASGLGSSVMSGLNTMGQMTGYTPFVNGLMGMGAPGTGSIAGPPSPGGAVGALGGGHPLLNLLLQGAGMAKGDGGGGNPRPPSPMSLGARQSPPLLNGPLNMGSGSAGAMGQRRPITIGSQAPVQLGI